MIFVTVGTQLAFDRLVTAMDTWAREHPEEKIFAQIGPSKLKDLAFPSEPFVSPSRADALFRDADLIVSHAGMGSILAALKYRKPLIVLPRRADLGEHRNDHQAATVKWLGDRPGIHGASTERELFGLLNSRGDLTEGPGISDSAAPELIHFLRNYFDTN